MIVFRAEVDVFPDYNKFVDSQFFLEVEMMYHDHQSVVQGQKKVKQKGVSLLKFEINGICKG